MLLLLLLPMITNVYSQVATPPRQVGFPYIRGHSSSKVHLEIFLDLICPDSREAWPNIKEVANLYGAEKVGLTVHMFPLPYHQNAFYASRAAFVIHYLTNGTKTFQWIERILLEKLPDLTDSAFYNKSDVDLLNLFEEYVSDMGVDVATFRDMVDRRNSNQFERYTRIMWKYACSRGVAGTPTYIVNGIVQPNIEQSWGLNEWKLFINPLLQPQLFDDIDYLEINQPEEVTQPSCSGNNRGSITPANKKLHLMSFVIALVYIPMSMMFVN